MTPIQKSISDAELADIDQRMERFGGQYIPAWQWSLIRARITPDSPAAPELQPSAPEPAPDRHTGTVRGDGVPKRATCLYIMAETAETLYRCTLADHHDGDHWNKYLANPKDAEDRQAAEQYAARHEAEKVDLVGALKKSIEAAKDRRLRKVGEFDGRDT